MEKDKFDLPQHGTNVYQFEYFRNPQTVIHFMSLIYFNFWQRTVLSHFSLVSNVISTPLSNFVFRSVYCVFNLHSQFSNKFLVRLF
jgi:hypothetical protein